MISFRHPDHSGVFIISYNLFIYCASTNSREIPFRPVCSVVPHPVPDSLASLF